MARIQAKFFLHGCVLVKDEASIDRLQRSGIGARQLNPIITSVETIDGSLTSAGPLLLLDEEVSRLFHIYPLSTGHDLLCVYRHST